MSVTLFRAMKLSSFVVALPFFVTGCANMEPGMRIDVDRVPSTHAAPMPEPVIKLITPDLIQEERAAREQNADKRAQALFGEARPYLIGPGDLLSILVWNHPELNIAAAGAQALTNSGAQSPAAFLVDSEGMIQFPFVGPIKVAGMTELQARSLLSKRLIKSIKDPDLTLRVLAYRSKRVYIDGDVKAPGGQAIDDVPMTLLEGVSRAGGFLPTADQSQVIVARHGVSYPVNVPELVRKGADLSRLMLASGDVVRVPNRDESKVFVLGEVTRPVALPMYNGKLSLAAALGEAGGLNQLSSSARQVYVIRGANEPKPVVYNLDAKSPVALAMAEGFELNPRDVVFVDASGLTRYNRIISLILPTAATAATSVGQLNR
ncbi:polysaccharide biosynthesis/export family protein [Massilia aerilata]|uniref:Polysaccharide biosynthesis/export family protein n=1 Tax=Massilia aerilata TaxID=453817 RepID=A0ABW0RT39_9BURK